MSKQAKHKFFVRFSGIALVEAVDEDGAADALLDGDYLWRDLAVDHAQPMTEDDDEEVGPTKWTG